MTTAVARADRPLSRPRLGFLGVGWIGRNRMEAILKEGLGEAVAICDPSKEMMSDATMVAPQAVAVHTLKELIDLELDGIVIATPSALHAEQSIQALEAGTAVFCQKPLGRNGAEVTAVVGAARRNNRLIGVDFSYRYSAAMQAVRSLLQDRAIGDIYAADLVFHNAYGPGKPWFYDRKLSGGGCVMDLGVHLVDLLLWVLDFPQVETVDAYLFSKGRRAAQEDVEDYAVATLGLRSGQVARLACSWDLHAGQDAVIGATFHGTEGALVFSNAGGSFYDFQAELCRGTSRELVASPPDAWGGRSAQAWARKLASGGEYDDDADHFIHVAKVLDRIYRL